MESIFETLYQAWGAILFAAAVTLLLWAEQELEEQSARIAAREYCAEIYTYAGER